jgi:Spy/CpxP family protein refolding chaperone
VNLYRSKPMNRQHTRPNLYTRRFALLIAGLALSATVVAGPQGRGAERGMEARLDRMTEQLSLTDSQRDQIQAILEEQRDAAGDRRQAVRERIDAVLTDEQRAQLDDQRVQRMDRRLARMSKQLDLTESQQQQIRAIWEERRADPDARPGEMRERIDAVLTDEQREKLAARFERGGRGKGPDGGPRRARDE